MILAIFFIYKSSLYFLPRFDSVGLSVQEKKLKIEAGHGGDLGFPIGKILAIFNFQVVPILPNKFRVVWHFHSGE